MALPLVAAGLLTTVLSYIAGAIVVRALVSLGIGIAVFTGVNLLLDSLKTEIFTAINNAGALAPTVINVMGMLQFDVFINMIFSAYAIRLAFIAPGGILKRFFLG